MPVATTTAHCEAVLDEIERVVVGKRAALTLILTTVLARGHVLIEDLPGLGKTLIARSFAAALGLDFTRVQFTPDLLPADLLGSTVYDMQSGRFEFRPGPIFTNLLLADEINRTPPKTQAALLEAMAEGQVSIDGATHRLPSRSSCWPPTTRSNTKAPIRCPRHSWTGSRSGSNCGTSPSSDEASMLRRRLDRGSAEPTVQPGRRRARPGGDARIGRAGECARRRPALRGVAGRRNAPPPPGGGRCQPARGTRPGATRPRPRPAAWPGLRDTRRHQGAGHARRGAPDHPAAGDVGAEDSRLRRRRGTVAAAAGSANARRTTVAVARDRDPGGPVALACFGIDARARHLCRGRRSPSR